MLKNKLLTVIALLLLAAFSSITQAHPDKIARLTGKITIQASAEAVFALVNQTDSEQAMRILTQEKEDSFSVALNEVKYKKKPEEIKNIKHIKYTLDVKDADNVFSLYPGKYILKIKLKQKGDKTKVKWITEYEVGNRGALSEAEKSAKKEAVKTFLDKGLDNLKSLAEAS